MSQTIKRISAAELVSVLSSTSTTPSFHPIIIDVRDDDFSGGNIQSAVHFPSSEASTTKISYLWNELKDSHADKKDAQKKVIFHCMLSQMRGPRIANSFLQSIGQEEIEEAGFEVAILEGGYCQFEDYVTSHKDKDLAKKMLENLEGQ